MDEAGVGATGAEEEGADGALSVGTTSASPGADPDPAATAEDAAASAATCSLELAIC